jgi:hypothetical protein
MEEHNEAPQIPNAPLSLLPLAAQEPTSSPNKN